MLSSYILLLSSSAAATAAATCYDIYKNVSTINGITPCDPTAEISPCCSEFDSCLTNGLYQNNGADGRITAQGCTNKDWAPPCLGELQFGNCEPYGDNYVALWMCRSSEGVIEVCCGGNDATCCHGALAGETSLFRMQVWGEVFTPGQKKPPTSGTPSSSGTGTSSTAGPTTSSSSESEKRTLSIDGITGIASACFFRVISSVIGCLHFKFVARESNTRGKPVRGVRGLWTLLARQYRLWFRGGIVKEFGDVRYPEEALELPIRKLLGPANESPVLWIMPLD